MAHAPRRALHRPPAPAPSAPRQLLAVAPRLEVLDLTGCEGVGDEICETLTSARVLNLSFVRITDDGLWTLAGAAPRLEALYLAQHRGNVWFSGLHTQEGVAGLRRRLPGLVVTYTM
jgi:hypothetical protein